MGRATAQLVAWFVATERNSVAADSGEGNRVLSCVGMIDLVHKYEWLLSQIAGRVMRDAPKFSTTKVRSCVAINATRSIRKSGCMMSAESDSLISCSPSVQRAERLCAL